MSLYLLLLLSLTLLPVPARAADDKLDLSTLGGTDTGGKEDPLKQLLSDAGAGDKKRFNVKTDNDINNLKRDDIYTDGLKTYFKITDVAAHDGRFEVERMAGSNNPDRKLQRV